MTIHLLLPMSGQGTRFQKAGYKLPKPLIPVSGRPMIERLLANFPARWPSVAVMSDNHASTDLKSVLLKMRPDMTVCEIPAHAKGPGFALLKALEYVPADAPVLVSYCDYGMSWDAARFEEFVEKTGCDACLVSYRGFHAHYLSPVPYAYSRMNGERVVEVKEKGWFGPDRELEYASCGAYYFRTASLLKEALAVQEQKKLLMNGESYTSLTIQALLEAYPGAHVRVFEIPYFYQWGTPEDLRIFEYWEKTLSAAAKYQGESAAEYRVDQILIPMCGLGSRFAALTETPKPFIQIGEKMMYEEAIESLPKGNTHIVALEKHGQHFAHRKTSITLLDSTPNGQALSVLAGLPSLADKGDIIISACDHAIVLNPKDWQAFRSKPDADAAIFTIQGFPGGARKPEAFAWVATEPKSTGSFPQVERVSVKKPLGDNPINDHLLVGTFWFKNKKILQEGIEKIIGKDIRVNGEIYLDSVFNELISSGLKIRIIPLEGYINWGDPDSLAESLYWQEVFFGRSYARRPRFPGVTLKS